MAMKTIYEAPAMQVVELSSEILSAAAAIMSLQLWFGY